MKTGGLFIRRKKNAFKYLNCYYPLPLPMLVALFRIAFATPLALVVTAFATLLNREEFLRA